MDGIAFVTNQDITLAQRQQITEFVGDSKVDLLHMERTVSILNSPKCYGIRLEYLDIEMTKEEQISYFEARDASFTELQKELGERIDKLQRHIENPDTSKILLSEELGRIRGLLMPFFEDPERRSIMSAFNFNLFGQQTPTIDQLEDLINQLNAFEQLLPSVNEKLQKFRAELSAIMGTRSPLYSALFGNMLGEPVTIAGVTVELLEYEKVLNRIIKKQEKLQKLQTDFKKPDIEN